jgi:hypothetical protein
MLPNSYSELHLLAKFAVGIPSSLNLLAAKVGTDMSEVPESNVMRHPSPLPSHTLDDLPLNLTSSS